MNIGVNVFDEFNNRKIKLKKTIEIYIKKLNKIFNKSISINELSESDIFDLYLCEQEQKARIISTLTVYKLSVKTLYLPLFINLLLAYKDMFAPNGNMLKNATFGLILILLMLVIDILYFRKKYYKEVENICNNEIATSQIAVIKQLKDLKYNI